MIFGSASTTLGIAFHNPSCKAISMVTPASIRALSTSGSVSISISLSAMSITLSVILDASVSINSTISLRISGNCCPISVTTCFIALRIAGNSVGNSLVISSSRFVTADANEGKSVCVNVGNCSAIALPIAKRTSGSAFNRFSTTGITFWITPLT